jgi:hypothetical protein
LPQVLHFAMSGVPQLNRAGASPHARASDARIQLVRKIQELACARPTSYHPQTTYNNIYEQIGVEFANDFRHPIVMVAGPAGSFEEGAPD